MLMVAGNAPLRARIGALARRKAEREHSHELFGTRLAAAYDRTFPEAMERLTRAHVDLG
jgi:hypothetical protein